jgi:hypothetical protein
LKDLELYNMWTADHLRLKIPAYVGNSDFLQPLWRNTEIKIIDGLSEFPKSYFIDPIATVSVLNNLYKKYCL